MNRIGRRHFLKHSATAVTASLLLSASCSRETEPPNIIFLLTDDQRWDTLGAMGNSIIHTPNMDALAQDGVLFTNAFVTTSICMTSRASIFLGEYARHHGINDFGTDFTPEQLQRTYPLLLRQHGYRIGFVGKYGVGSTLPEDAYDYWRGVAGQPDYENVDEAGNFIHSTQLFGNQALEFLRGCSAEQPFCLSVSFKAPHCQDGDPRQFIYDERFADLYTTVDIPAPQTTQSRYLEQLPDFLRNDATTARRRWFLRFTPKLYQHMVKSYYRLISGVDAVIGQIREELQRLGFADNTVIALMGDNGFFLGEHGLAGKWYGYEESIRVPLVFYDPRLPRSKRGQTREEMALNIDIAPTLLDLAGVPHPRTMQGQSLMPLLRGKSPTWREAFLYEHLFTIPQEAEPRAGNIPNSEGVRTRRYKYLRYPEQRPVYEQLFDVQQDPRETRNLADHDDYQDVLRRLRQRTDELIRHYTAKEQTSFAINT